MAQIENLLDSLHRGSCCTVACSSSQSVPMQRRRVVLPYAIAIFVHLADRNLIRGFRFGGAAGARINDKSGHARAAFCKVGLMRTVIRGFRALTRVVTE